MYKVVKWNFGSNLMYISVLPSGRSKVLLGVRTTGKLLLCFPPRRNPVLEVSTSDMMPGSSSKSIAVDGGGYPRGKGD